MAEFDQSLALVRHKLLRTLIKLIDVILVSYITCFPDIIIYCIIAIGLSDYYQEGDFRWKSNHSIPEFTNWDINQPDNFHGNEDCVYINGQGKWNDLRCLTDSIQDRKKTYFISALCQH